MIISHFVHVKLTRTSPCI